MSDDDDDRDDARLRRRARTRSGARGSTAGDLATGPAPGRSTRVEADGGGTGRPPPAQGEPDPTARERRDDVEMEQLATRFAYQGNPGSGEEHERSINDERDLHAMGMVATTQIAGTRGFSMLVTTRRADAPGGRARSIVAFRGSDDVDDAIDDTNPAGIGEQQYAANEALIVRTLTAIGGAVDVTGHSLGGAIAQLVAARHPELVARVFTYQAPGIGRADVAGMQRTAAGRAIRSRHHVVAQDVVHQGGEAHTPGATIVHSNRDPSLLVELARAPAGPAASVPDAHRSMPVTEEAIEAGTAPPGARIADFRYHRTPTAPAREVDAPIGWGEQPRVIAGHLLRGELGGAVVELIDPDADDRARSPVQRAASGAHAGLDDSTVQRVAAAGAAGPGAELPHLAAIQRSFGRHDVTATRAHVGGAAARAAGAIGASAYATGGDVAFARAPDLRLAAHEAAHVVQQRAGVQLAGGVGSAGDPYERHADAVAELVVRGASAEALLDTMAGGGTASAGGPAAAVQREGGAIDRIEGHLDGGALDLAVTDDEAMAVDRELTAMSPARAMTTLREMERRGVGDDYFDNTSETSRHELLQRLHRGGQVQRVQSGDFWVYRDDPALPASVRAAIAATNRRIVSRGYARYERELAAHEARVVATRSLDELRAAGRVPTAPAPPSGDAVGRELAYELMRAQPTNYYGGVAVARHRHRLQGTTPPGTVTAGVEVEAGVQAPGIDATVSRGASIDSLGRTTTTRTEQGGLSVHDPTVPDDGTSLSLAHREGTRRTSTYDPVLGTTRDRTADLVEDEVAGQARGRGGGVTCTEEVDRETGEATTACEIAGDAVPGIQPVGSVNRERASIGVRTGEDAAVGPAIRVRGEATAQVDIALLQPDTVRAALPGSGSADFYDDDEP
jgi:hypothetical protein